MEEIAYLVLLERRLLTGKDAARRRVRGRDRVGIDVLPVRDRDTSRREQVAVRAEGLPGIRDRLVARRPGRVRARQCRDPREEVAVAALDHEDLRLAHLAIHTFCLQSGRSERSTPSTRTRSRVGPCSTSSMTTPGFTPWESRYSRKPCSCSN